MKNRVSILSLLMTTVVVMFTASPTMALNSRVRSMAKKDQISNDHELKKNNEESLPDMNHHQIHDHRQLQSSTTAAPSECADIVAYINWNALVDRPLTLTGTTAEDKALQWLVNNDGEFPCWRRLQRYALATLAFQNSNQWRLQYRWASVNHECNWDGAVCSNSQYPDTVTSILLQAEGMAGTMPPDLGLLKQLRGFNIRSNQDMVGTLPSTYGLWTDLESIDISANGFTGTIPSTVGAWTKLVSANFHINAFSGQLPEAIGQWSQLRSFQIHNNLLSGAVPNGVGNWNNIQLAWLHCNRITGTIPGGICRADGNPLSLFADCEGPSPEVECSCCTGCYTCTSNTFAPATRYPSAAPVSECANLVTYINQNALVGRPLTLTGTTPEEKALQWLFYNDTAVHNSCSRKLQRYALATLAFQNSDQWISRYMWASVQHECKWIGVACANDLTVTSVSLNGRGLAGTMPPDLGLLKLLRRFDIGRNVYMSGTLPSTYGLWTDLEYIHIGANGFSGTIPTTVGAWTKLKSAYFSFNSFSGQLPEAIGQWSQLRHVDVSSNQLSGHVPTGVGNWNIIEAARFACNRITGTMPVGICREDGYDLSLSADCLGTTPEISCSCCTRCVQCI